MTEADRTELVERYSQARISLAELDRVTFGDVLIELAWRGLPLPRTPVAGREQRVAAARALLFPKAA